MARLTWKTDIVNGILTCTDGKDGDQVVMIPVQELFSAWSEFTECQKQVICYGLKQKVSDTGAKSADLHLSNMEKASIMQANADRIVYDQEFNAKPRTLTPLEKKEREYKRLIREVDSYRETLAGDFDEAVIDSMLNKMFGEKIDNLEKEIDKLK